MKHLLLMLLLTGLLAGANELLNPSLEVDGNGKIPHWRAHQNAAVTIVTDVVHSGKTAVMGESAIKGDKRFGLMQEITYDKPSKLPILFSGWSKAEDVSGTRDYDIYLDLWYEDGTNDWAKIASWAPGTHDWERASGCYRPYKPVSKIEYFILLRYVDGKAWYDDLEMLRQEPDVQIGSIMIRSLYPLSDNGLMISADFFADGVAYECQLVDAAGKVLATLKDKGRTIHWQALLPENNVADKLIVLAEKDGKTARYEQKIVAKGARPVNPVKGAYQVWTADSMQNISPLAYPAADAQQAIALELAKGERESAQIQVTAGAKPLNNVSVTLPQLKNQAGQALKGSLKWNRVGYIPRHPKGNIHHFGYDRNEFWLPDPLLTPRDFTVSANATQGVWLTVYAERDAQPGLYSGDVLLTIDGKTEKVPVQVTVWNFALPKTFSYPTAFCIMDGHLFHVYGDGDRNARRREAWDIMLDHRLNPDDISRTEMPRIEDLLYARERGMNRFNIMNMVPKPSPNYKGLWVCFSSEKAYTPALFEEFKTRLDPYVAELRKHDLTKYAYVYGFDERADSYYPIIADVHKLLKERYPDIAFMTTSKMYKSLIDKPERTDCYANDWYCPLTSVYNLELSDKLRAKGHKVWWYTCCGPQYPYANFSSVEYPFIEGRLIAWQTYQYRADGLLFWHVNLWNTPRRLDETTCYQKDFKSSEVVGMVGDGQFLYPGANGPLASIRLENLRDGSEDYDYLTMAGGQARALCGELSKSMTEFTRDPKQIRAARKQLADWILKK